MKNILCGAVAAIALVAISAPAAAQTNERHYASASLNRIETNPTGSLLAAADNHVDNLGIGTRYTATASAPGNAGTAKRTVSVKFRLSGTVNKDCSFYAGNDSSARNIDFGVIGIRAGNNVNVQNAFTMVGPATANINSTTAGCNFNNEVEIVKDDSRGLVNSSTSGYDTQQFQANIPYSVSAQWTGVNLGNVGVGGAKQLNVGINATSATKQQGAWRSTMNIDINAPVVTKGLVAGNYRGSTTLTLRAL